MVRTFTLVLISGILIGCGIQATPEAAATPQKTFSPTPLPTPTLTPTPMPLPAPKGIPVEAEGFTLLVPPDLEFDLQSNTIGVIASQGMIVVSFIRAPYDGNANSMQDVISEYLGAVSRSAGEITQGESLPIVIAGLDGVAVDLTGILYDAPFEGRAVAVSPGENSVFFGLGIATLSDDMELWKTAGSEIFQSLLDSVEFVEVQTSGTCIVSRITGAGRDVVLYLDEYCVSPPQAPIGFTCVGGFPLIAT